MDVMIKVSARQSQPDSSDEDVIELLTEGTYEYDGFHAVITYKESEITGFNGCMTVLTVTSEKVTMSREGSDCSEMIFELGRRHNYCYSTLAGNMILGVHTIGTHLCLDNNGGTLELTYLLDLDNRVFSRNTLNMTIQ